VAGTGGCRGWVALGALALVTVSCGGREVTFPDLAVVEAPPFVERPVDPRESAQLDALPVRDTAGLVPDSASASAALLAPALARAAELDPAPTRFNRISIYDGDVFLTWADPAAANRSVSASYDADGGWYVSEPRFDDEATFTLERVDVGVPARLVAAIEERHPHVRVTSIDLRVGLSYGFGLAWYVEVTDARGTLATVFADLDGTILAVDGW
jgi:hypothetical protein